MWKLPEYGKDGGGDALISTPVKNFTEGGMPIPRASLEPFTVS